MNLRFLNRRIRQVMRWGAIALVLVLLSAPVAAGTAGLMQMPSLPSLPTPPIQPAPDRRPSSVERVGDFDVMLVHFDGVNLFRVTQPAPRADAPFSDQFLVENRVTQIQNNLEAVVTLIPTDDRTASVQYRTRFDPETLQVAIAQLNSDTVLLARDVPNVQTQQLLTVTQLDAEYHNTSIEELAERWRERLEEQLQMAARDRQPEALARSLGQAIKILLIVLLLSAGLIVIKKLLNRRHRDLQARRAEARVNSGLGHSHAEAPATHHPREFWLPSLLMPYLNVERRISINAFLRWFTFWGLVFVWLGGIRQVLNLFPWGRSISRAFWVTPISVLVIWFVVGLLNRLGDIAINRFARAWEENEFFPFEGDTIQRRYLRISTISQALKGLKTFMIFALGLAWVLSIVGVPIESVLTLGALLAFAFSLASQNLIRDLVNGFLILVEDQYGIGDIIEVDGLAGLVENMNLRITQLRNSEGRLITIPNSSITQVQNLTRVWSRVDLTVTIAYDADVQLALQVLNTISEEMYNEPEWQQLMVKPPQVLGIDEVTHAGLLIRIWLETHPLQQFTVGREFRYRMRLALEEHGIGIGMPQQQLRYGEHFPPDIPPNSPADNGTSPDGIPHDGTLCDGNGAPSTSGEIPPSAPAEV